MARRSREPKPLVERTCALPSCGKPFKQRVYWQEYCSPLCGGRARYNRFLDNLEDKAAADALQTAPDEVVPGTKIRDVQCSQRHAGVKVRKRKEPKDGSRTDG